MVSNDAQTGPPVAADVSSSGPNIRIPSYLGASLTIKGEIEGDEDLKLDGNIEGPISLGNHRLTVGATAHTAGGIVAREIVIYGNVKGNLRAHDRIEIKKDSSVLGDITTPRISIEDGAYFKGNIEIERNAAKIGTDPDTLLALAEKNFKLKSIRAADSTQ